MIFSKVSNGLFCSTILFFVLNSCVGQDDDCLKMDLSKEEKGWFTNHKDGDTIYFLSSSQERDTFVVNASDILSYTSCNTFELGPYVYQLGSFSFRSTDNYAIGPNRKRYSIGFNKIGQDSTMLNCKKRIRFFDLSAPEFYDFSKVPTQEFTIPRTGEKIQLFIYTKNYNCSNQEGGPEIMEEFAISKKYGLVWYRTVQGDTYSRVW
jgi:hypothetical protein